MAARKKSKAGTKPRRWVLVLLGVCVVIIAVVSFTTPQQLPGLIADRPAVRVVYTWKEGAALWLHRQIYPLSALRTDTVPPVKKGTGYDDEDRAVLDALIDAKTDVKD